MSGTFNNRMHQKAGFIIFFLFLNFYAVFSQQVLSLNPLFTEQTAILMPETESTWNDGDINSVSVKQLGDNFYRLQYADANKVMQYEAVFVSVANKIILDLVPKLPDTLWDNDYRAQIQPTHSFYKVDFLHDNMQLAEFNYVFFYNELVKKKSLLPHTSVDGGLLITGSTIELKQFIEAHILEPDFFNKPLLFTRDSVAKIGKKKIASLIPGNDTSRKFFQQCIPEFPHKDGWLGGDADISVPINDTQSLYIFGDTYVGKKNDTRQSKELKMISSTVAISTCLPNSTKHIKYYWRNMYSNHPEPIFRSFTNRYNLWASNAFSYKNCLYVFMQKTGAKAGVAPDDFFAFSTFGFTFAKVVNPTATTPDEWDVEFIPISLFGFPINNLHISLVKYGNYLYLFAENDIKTKLLRVALDFIDSPQNHLEYYSINRTWNLGVKPDDMAVVLPAQIGYTINYHDELKKWLMVCGPGFLNNKIGLRTATSLTGPWSDEIIVYKCPEITPGTASFNKAHFGYFGRECFQNYDKKNRTMVITYDINTTDFFEINSNPKIYTPKVITIPLMKYGIR